VEVGVMPQKKEIYILLTNTGTWFTKLIKLFTKASYNHASISFDNRLTAVFSFGRKHPMNPFIGGFVKEDIRSGIFRNATCLLYRCTVSEVDYDRMRKYVQTFEENPDLYKYNLLGLFGILLNKEISRKHAFFCSEFVASVFLENGVNIVEKPSVFTRPSDFSTSGALQLVYFGKMNKFHGNPGEALLEMGHSIPSA
jgi:hypothetical protein